mmetsp:Transcript_15962/g.52383  ORF Transcript_15962/g.52383 Transcript_15962/m.52383 type:complete len:214 (+) Transcript_15962:783-1424(+)
MVSPTFSSPPSVKTVNRPLSLAVPFSSLNFTQTTDGNFTTPNVLATAPLSSSARAYPNAALFFRPTLNFTATEASQERFEDVFDPDATPSVNNTAFGIEESPWCRNECTSAYGSLGASRSSTEVFAALFKVTNSTMPSLSRAPSYFSPFDAFSRPAEKERIVGNPETPCVSHSALCLSQSTAASVAGAFSFLIALAAASYSGASFLQWPHQGA